MGKRHFSLDQVRSALEREYKSNPILFITPFGLAHLTEKGYCPDISDIEQVKGLLEELVNTSIADRAIVTSSPKFYEQTTSTCVGYRFRPQ